MAVVNRVFFDTSVLLAGLIDLGSPAAHAQRAMAAVADARVHPHTAWHCCLEFYAVSTRLPEEVRLSPADALKLIEEEIMARFVIHELPAKARMSFFRTAAQEQIIGGRAYDAHIAEVARSAGATIVVTDNRPHFLTLVSHGIRVLSAKEFVIREKL